MSADLVWQLVRNQNSYLVKGRTTQGDNTLFSREASNLINRHSQKFSGIANRATVGINAVNNKVVLTKTRGFGKKVRRNVENIVLGRHVANHRCAGAEAVRHLTGNSFYRADLTQYAVARYNAVNRSIRVKGAAPSVRRNRRAANSTRK